MKKLASVAAIASIAVLAACGSHKTTTVTTSNGTATITQDQNGQQTSVTTKEGTVTVGGSADPNALGAPVYPGATKNDDQSSFIVTGKDAGAYAAFKTADAFDKVYDYYKSQLPAGSEKMKMASGDTSLAEFDMKDPKGETLVEVQGKTGETVIIITHKAQQ